MDEEIVVLPNFQTLEISELTAQMQNQNGLNYQDYRRYFDYCRNKHRKLRKLIGIKCGSKKQYVKKNIQDYQADPRILTLLIIQAEKEWARSTFFKNNQSNKRTKFIVRKKLKRSIQTIEKMKVIAQNRIDNKTELEIQAYENHLHSLLSLEYQKYQDAQDYLIKARAIYSQLQILKPKNHLNIKINAIDQLIRFCNLKTTQENLSIQQILQLKTENLDPSLSSKFEELLEEHRKLMGNTQKITITYHGQEYTIQNEKFQQIFYQVEQLKQTQSQLILSDSKNYDLILSNYIEMFSNYDDLVKLGAEQEKVVQFVIKEKLIQLMNRNQVHIFQAVQKFHDEGNINNLQEINSKKAQRNKQTSPQEIIRYTENYIQTQKQLLEHERMNPDVTFFQQIDHIEQVVKNIKLFFLICLYFINKKYREAISLMQLLRDQIVSLNDQKKQLEFSKNYYQILNQFDQYLQRIEIEAKIKSIEDSNKKQSETIELMNELKISEIIKNEHTRLCGSNELGSYLSCVENLLILNKIAVKPINLDIAYEHVSYPSFKHLYSQAMEQEQEKKTGFWSKLNIFKK